MIIGVVLAFLILNISTAQKVHVVGDSLGWVVPKDGASVYQKWATAQQFTVGDILTFNFETGNHDIVKVPKESFNACTSSNAIGKVITNGPANVTLETVGEHYYICSAGQHCQHGQKLSISISATPGGVSPTPANTPTTPTTLSPTPTSHDPITPNAPSPSNSVNSSVLKVFVGVLVPIMSLIIGLLF